MLTEQAVRTMIGVAGSNYFKSTIRTFKIFKPTFELLNWNVIQNSRFEIYLPDEAEPRGAPART
jgi:hypothetical protein